MKKNNIKQRILETLRQEERSVVSLWGCVDVVVDIVESINKRPGRIVLTGIGKSSYVGMKIAATLTSLGQEAFFLNTVDALHGDMGRIKNGDVLFAISFSGESSELIKLLKHLRKSFDIKIFSITGGANSSLSKISDKVIILDVKEEGCPIGLAPMASTTASLVVGDLIASGLVNPIAFSKENFAKFHPGGNIGLSLKRVDEVMITGAGILKTKEDSTFGNSLNEMNKSRLGVIAVLDKKGKLSGVITDGDVRRIFLKYDDPKKLSTREVMKLNPITINKKSSLKDALSLMSDSKITSLFVVDANKKLLGLIRMPNIVDSFM